MKTIETDCLIIGSGVAGSMYAVEAAGKGLNCVILAAHQRENSNSWLAQGGIILPQEDDKDLLYKDILSASANTSNPVAVRSLIQNGRQIMQEQVLKFADFDKNNQGNFDLAREAAHSINRIVHSKDQTGKHLTKALWEQIPSSVTVLEDHMAVDLLTLSHSSTVRTDRYKPSQCFGAYVFNSSTQEVLAILAKRTILATGGLGQIFASTTNHQDAFGHGVSMAHRLGARIMDMEFVQFHPTTLQIPGWSQQFLISEAVRGQGAVFLNSRGENFMNLVHPLGALAPRDIISRAVFMESMKTGVPHVYLDLTRIKKVKDQFPEIYSQCLKAGIDITIEPLPVAPAAHYSCGGIYADMQGSTSILGLKAIGENACTGLHGANRLASTSLLECVVMGSLAARQDAEQIRIEMDKFPEVRPWHSASGIADMDLIHQDLKLIKSTMWNYVGLVRTKKRLQRAHKILTHLKEETDEFYKNCKLSPGLLNLRSAIYCSLLVVYAAFRNKESEGCHYRNDEMEEAMSASHMDHKLKMDTMRIEK